ncbi:MAG: ATP-binding protein [Candidatus Aminicenantes bacterium]|nr:ATP-binding protein [Candidatus Aminicenantes bacterium]
MKQLTVSSDMAELDKIRAFLKETLKKLTISEDTYFQIELALHEICVNIIRYAYPKEKGDIIIRVWTNKKKVFLEVKDSGFPFDPHTAEKPQVERMIKENLKGGMGIHLSRQLMDEFTYKRDGNHNVLLMVKHL